MIQATALVLLLGASAREQPKVAVMQVDDSAGLPATDLDALTDRARAELTGAGLDVVAGVDVLGAQSCLDQACRKRVLAPQGVRYWVTTQITGADRMYEVRMRLWSAAQDVALAECHEQCVVCGYAELAERVAAEASELGRSIVVDASESAVLLVGESPYPTAAPPDTAPAGRSPRPLQTKPRDHGPRLEPTAAWRPTGIALTVVGIGTVGLGAGLLAIDGNALPRRCGPGNPQNLDSEGDCRYVHRTQGGGIISVVAGAVLSVAGATLLVADARGRTRDRRRRASVDPSLGLRHIGVRGRF